MNQLWTPWRMEYILGSKPDSCVFCLPQTTNEDEERLILLRGASSFVVMNKYPYNNGHIMVCPYRHLMDITDLSREESTEIMDLLKRCTAILRQHFHCEGINIGLNLGQAAGAGIREHLHFHLVPRWNGDSSFMAVLGDVRTIPEHLRQTHKALGRYFT
jgi:ATP adenylyltransferase